MENYKHASGEGQKMILSFIKQRMIDLKMDVKTLSDILNLNEKDVLDFLAMAEPIPLNIFLEMLGALKIRPYFIPAEADNTKMNRRFFN